MRGTQTKNGIFNAKASHDLLLIRINLNHLSTETRICDSLFIQISHQIQRYSIEKEARAHHLKYTLKIEIFTYCIR